jgi:hypothetical protein
MDENRPKWVLVAGTGRPSGLADAERWCAEELGTMLAEAGYGLVAGGWPGVDYICADAFAKAIRRQGKELSDYLIQVVWKDRAPDFRGGYVVEVPRGPDEWKECVRFASAVILVGGEGGTYETYLFAAQELRPVIPLAGTGGDSARVFREIQERWSAEQIGGITLQDFQKVAPRISSPEDARSAAGAVRELLGRHFEYAASAPRRLRRNKVFISYSHKDEAWRDKVRSLMEPLERQGRLAVFDDTGIRAGDSWLERIQTALDQTKVAVLLVSPNFLKSEFIQQSELPALLQAAGRGEVRVRWIHISPSSFRDCEFAKYQAAHEKVDRALDDLSPAEENAALVEIAREIRAAVEAP